MALQNSARLTVPGGPSIACSTAKAVEWDAAWSKNLDPSGRAALGVHVSAYADEATNVNSIVQATNVNSIVPSKMIDTIPRMEVSTSGLKILS